LTATNFDTYKGEAMSEKAKIRHRWSMKNSHGRLGIAVCRNKKNIIIDTRLGQSVVPVEINELGQHPDSVRLQNILIDLDNLIAKWSKRNQEFVKKLTEGKDFERGSMGGIALCAYDVGNVIQKHNKSIRQAVDEATKEKG